TVKRAVSDAGIQYESAEVTMIPQTNVRIEGRDAEHMIRLMEALEDSDDVQNVYANFDIDEQLLEAIG
ncbi:MAG: YebC/PmpR family DNA-binding transcriptional regulator, partial [Candidatus Dadabacteria bacterium]|nr:YebC/PmpR family DNA-binding transcriptional regulator [Candidatus Dadabacteria bacterium]